jgi:hypothetical protein
VLLTLAVGGLVAVASPWALVAVPTLAWRFTVDNPNYWGTGWHYSMLLMPIMAFAAVDVMRRRPWTQGIAAVVMAAVTVLGIVPNQVLPSALSKELQPSALRDTPRQLAGERVIATIPPGASVASDIGLITHLATRDPGVTWIGTEPVDRAPQWIVLDHDPLSNIGTPEDAAQYGLQRYAEHYRTVLRAKPFQVARLVPQSSADLEGGN